MEIINGSGRRHYIADINLDGLGDDELAFQIRHLEELVAHYHHSFGFDTEGIFLFPQTIDVANLMEADIAERLLRDYRDERDTRGN